MDQPEKVTRRKAIRVMGRTTLGATALAGVFELVGRAGTARAGQLWALCVGCCGGPCQKGYWCYVTDYQGNSVYACCKSSGQSELNGCTQP
jgi:hypothetical protein